ncbi:lysophospholipid acyltransferase family protein [Polyangium sp. y55x31]|uniref:lysophospholipid acyltransferase family protein n=1 Tax=Polyangium sp. y55x31 TaxID=3042688 RepID=UPI0024832A7F|nr:lysophospholipid acyltransferase family protein [Polyangium sp. y55x31]MDI1475819.1 lysophospholipid acyltransferase family protein [Polyangium sp. y55x31]
MGIGDDLGKLIDDLRRHDSVLWRRALDAGVTHGPRPFVRYAPPLIGLAFGLALGRQRRAVRENLRRALGPRNALVENVDVARVFASFASCLTEAFLVGRGRPERLVGLCASDENYVQAASEGRGVIIATAHTGGWQAAGPILRSVHTADVVVVMAHERDERAEALTDDARDKAGVRIVHVGTSPLDALPLLSHLRRGGVVAVQIDRLPKGMRGREVTLFGEPFVVPEGPLSLAALSGAPIVPVFTRRLGYMRYEVRSCPPISLPRRPSEDELSLAARRVAAAMESFLRENPTQWFHFE